MHSGLRKKAFYAIIYTYPCAYCNGQHESLKAGGSPKVLQKAVG